MLHPASFGASHNLASQPGLVGYWRLGEVSGTVAKDETGRNPGTYTNTPTKPVTGPLSGDPDGAVTFAAASSQYVSIADDNSLDLTDGPLSIIAWIKRGAGGSGSIAVLSKGIGAYYLRVNLSNDRLQFLKSTFALIADSDPVTITTAGGWYHVAATKNGSRIALYINGSEVTANVSNATFVDNAGALTIGADVAGTADFMDGTIGEVALFARELTRADINRLYRLGRGF